MSGNTISEPQTTSSSTINVQKSNTKSPTLFTSSSPFLVTEHNTKTSTPFTKKFSQPQFFPAKSMSSLPIFRPYPGAFFNPVTPNPVSDNPISEPQTNMTTEPLINVSTTSNAANLVTALKYKEAMEYILNNKNVLNINDILKLDVSNQTYLTLNNYEHKEIFCNWLFVKSKICKFKVFENTNSKKFVVHHLKEKPLIDINPVKIDLCCRLYKPKCSNNFKMQVFFTNKHKLIRFLGNKPKNCSCTNSIKKTTAFLTNKDKTPSEIYLTHPTLFKDPQDVSNLKRKLSSTSQFNSSKNIADELQHIEEKLSKDGFVQDIHIIEKYDVNGVPTDLPLVILYDKLILCEMLNSALKSKLVIHFDKTYNTSIFHLSTFSYLSNNVLHKVSKKPAQILGTFLLHKSSSKQVFSHFF